MKRLATVALIIITLTSIGLVLAGEEKVEITSDANNITLYPGQAKTITVIVKSIQDDEGDTTSTNNPTTSPSTTTNPPTTPGPPEPPSAPSILESSYQSSSLSSFQQSSTSLYLMMYTPQLTLRSDAPEGLSVSFDRESMTVPYDTDIEVDVRIEASETIEVGEYVVPITVRSNTGHYDTVDIAVTVLPYIDVVLNDVSISDTLPKAGETVEFTVSVTNNGEDPTGVLTCAVYEKETNERIATKDVSLKANETKVFTIEWVTEEGAYNFRVFISSPENEKITTNNFFFLSLKVGPAFMPVDKGEEYFSQGLVYYESKKWQDAVDSFTLSIVEFTNEGKETKLVSAQKYLELAEKYLEASTLYQEGMKAIDDGDLVLAKEKLQAAERLYTELGDIEYINLCFNEILNLSTSGESDPISTESSLLPYPWYSYTVPIVLILVFLGYTTRPRPSESYEDMLARLEERYRKGRITESEYIKEKYKIKLKILEKYA